MMSNDKIVSNDVTASEQTDAPHCTVVVENRRNPVHKNLNTKTRFVCFDLM